MDILQFKDGVVSVRKGFEELEEIKAIWNSDKHEGKKFYNRILDYTFLVYSPSSPFAEYFYEERKKEWEKLRGNKFNEVESNPKAKRFIEKYMELSQPFTKRSLAKVRKDIETLHKRLSDIPFEIPIKVELFVDIPEYKDAKTTIKYPVKTTVMMDNSKAKKEAIDMFDKLYELYEKLSRKAEYEGADEEDEYTTITEMK